MTATGGQNKKREGRPTALTQDVVDKLVLMVQMGNHLHIARMALGIPEETMRHWKRYANEDPHQSRHAIHRQLFKRLASARAEGEVTNITIIARAARNGDVGCAKWLEERLGPERWGRVKDVDDDSRAKKSDPYAQLPGDELAQKRAATG